jgi:hypothetical protein
VLHFSSWSALPFNDLSLPRVVVTEGVMLHLPLGIPTPQPKTRPLLDHAIRRWAVTLFDGN